MPELLLRFDRTVESSVDLKVHVEMMGRVILLLKQANNLFYTIFPQIVFLTTSSTAFSFFALYSNISGRFFFFNFFAPFPQKTAFSFFCPLFS